MNRRETILAICVGVLIVAAGLFYGSKKVVTAITERTDQIRDLEQEVDGKEVMAHRGVVAGRLLASYGERSLPTELQLAELPIS